MSLSKVGNRYTNLEIERSYQRHKYNNEGPRLQQAKPPSLFLYFRVAYHKLRQSLFLSFLSSNGSTPFLYFLFKLPCFANLFPSSLITNRRPPLLPYSSLFFLREVPSVCLSLLFALLSFPPIFFFPNCQPRQASFVWLFIAK